MAKWWNVLEKKANNRSLFKCHSKLLYTIANGISAYIYVAQDFSV